MSSFSKATLPSDLANGPSALDLRRARAALGRQSGTASATSSRRGSFSASATTARPPTPRAAAAASGSSLQRTASAAATKTCMDDGDDADFAAAIREQQRLLRSDDGVHVGAVSDGLTSEVPVVTTSRSGGAYSSESSSNERPQSQPFIIPAYLRDHLHSTAHDEARDGVRGTDKEATVCEEKEEEGYSNYDNVRSQRGTSPYASILGDAGTSLAAQRSVAGRSTAVSVEGGQREECGSDGGDSGSGSGSDGEECYCNGGREADEDGRHAHYRHDGGYHHHEHDTTDQLAQQQGFASNDFDFDSGATTVHQRTNARKQALGDRISMLRSQRGALRSASRDPNRPAALHTAAGPSTALLRVPAAAVGGNRSRSRSRGRSNDSSNRGNIYADGSGSQFQTPPAATRRGQTTNNGSNNHYTYNQQQQRVKEKVATPRYALQTAAAAARRSRDSTPNPIIAPKQPSISTLPTAVSSSSAVGKSATPRRATFSGTVRPQRLQTTLVAPARAAASGAAVSGHDGGEPLYRSNSGAATTVHLAAASADNVDGSGRATLPPTRTPSADDLTTTTTAAEAEGEAVHDGGVSLAPCDPSNGAEEVNGAAYAEESGDGDFETMADGEGVAAESSPILRRPSPSHQQQQQRSLAHEGQPFGETGDYLGFAPSRSNSSAAVTPMLTQYGGGAVNFDHPLQRPTACFYHHTDAASPYRQRYPNPSLFAGGAAGRRERSVSASAVSGRDASYIHYGYAEESGAFPPQHYAHSSSSLALPRRSLSASSAAAAAAPTHYFGGAAGHDSYGSFLHPSGTFSAASAETAAAAAVRRAIANEYSEGVRAAAFAGDSYDDALPSSSFINAMGGSSSRSASVTNNTTLAHYMAATAAVAARAPSNASAAAAAIAASLSGVSSSVALASQRNTNSSSPAKATDILPLPPTAGAGLLYQRGQPYQRFVATYGGAGLGGSDGFVYSEQADVEEYGSDAPLTHRSVSGSRATANDSKSTAFESPSNVHFEEGPQQRTTTARQAAAEKARIAASYFRSVDDKKRALLLRRLGDLEASEAERRGAAGGGGGGSAVVSGTLGAGDSSQADEEDKGADQQQQEGVHSTSPPSGIAGDEAETFAMLFGSGSTCSDGSESLYEWTAGLLRRAEAATAAAEGRSALLAAELVAARAEADALRATVERQKAEAEALEASTAVQRAAEAAKRAEAESAAEAERAGKAAENEANFAAELARLEAIAEGLRSDLEDERQKSAAAAEAFAAERAAAAAALASATSAQTAAQHDMYETVVAAHGLDEKSDDGPSAGNASEQEATREQAEESAEAATKTCGGVEAYYADLLPDTPAAIEAVEALQHSAQQQQRQFLCQPQYQSQTYALASADSSFASVGGKDLVIAAGDVGHERRQGGGPINDSFFSSASATPLISAAAAPYDDVQRNHHHHQFDTDADDGSVAGDAETPTSALAPHQRSNQQQTTTKQETQSQAVVGGGDSRRAPPAVEDGSAQKAATAGDVAILEAINDALRSQSQTQVAKLRRLETQRAWLVAVIAAFGDHEARLRAPFRHWQEAACRPVVVTERQRALLAAESEAAVAAAIEANAASAGSQMAAMAAEAERHHQSAAASAAAAAAASEAQTALLRAQLESAAEDMGRAAAVVEAHKAARNGLEAQLEAAAALQDAMAGQIEGLMTQLACASADHHHGDESEQQRLRQSNSNNNNNNNNNNNGPSSASAAAGGRAVAAFRSGKLLPHQEREQEQIRRLGESEGGSNSNNNNNNNGSSLSAEEKAHALKLIVAKERRHCTRLSAALGSHQSVLRESADAYAELLQHAELWFQQLYYLRRFCEEAHGIRVPRELRLGTATTATANSDGGAEEASLCGGGGGIDAAAAEAVIEMERRRVRREAAQREERLLAARLLQCPAVEDADGAKDHQPMPARHQTRDSRLMSHRCAAAEAVSDDDALECTGRSQHFVAEEEDGRRGGGGRDNNKAEAAVVLDAYSPSPQRCNVLLSHHQHQQQEEQQRRGVSPQTLAVLEAATAGTARGAEALNSLKAEMLRGADGGNSPLKIFQNGTRSPSLVNASGSAVGGDVNVTVAPSSSSSMAPSHRHNALPAATPRHPTQQVAPRHALPTPATVVTSSAHSRGGAETIDGTGGDVVGFSQDPSDEKLAARRAPYASSLQPPPAGGGVGGGFTAPSTAPAAPRGGGPSTATAATTTTSTTTFLLDDSFDVGAHFEAIASPPPPSTARRPSTADRTVPAVAAQQRQQRPPQQLKPLRPAIILSDSDDDDEDGKVDDVRPSPSAADAAPEEEEVEMSPNARRLEEALSTPPMARRPTARGHQVYDDGGGTTATSSSEEEDEEAVDDRLLGGDNDDDDEPIRPYSPERLAAERAAKEALKRKGHEDEKEKEEEKAAPPISRIEETATVPPVDEAPLPPPPSEANSNKVKAASASADITSSSERKSEAVPSVDKPAEAAAATAGVASTSDAMAVDKPMTFAERLAALQEASSSSPNPNNAAALPPRSERTASQATRSVANNASFASAAAAFTNGDNTTTMPSCGGGGGGGGSASSAAVKDGSAAAVGAVADGSAVEVTPRVRAGSVAAMLAMFERRK